MLRAEVFGPLGRIRLRSENVDAGKSRQAVRLPERMLASLGLAISTEFAKRCLREAVMALP